MPIKRNILIADDEQDLVSILETSLSQPHYIFHNAYNCDEAFDCIINNFVDVVITDVRMEHENGGIELLKKIKSLPYDDRPKVIVMTGAPDLDEKEAYDLGAIHFLKKPFNPEILSKIIDDLFQK